MITLSTKWTSELASKPETGMGYQVVSIILNDGRRFDQVVVVEGLITKIRGRKDIPFTEKQIVQIIVTHDKWDFKADTGL
ncbi:MAG: hypothetical protein EPN47_13240 [Acidobacteria bacterium]|nr:MAG: hypothetical protein EPN47_13240 [Acidobacteriota bacterium]